MRWNSSLLSCANGANLEHRPPGLCAQRSCTPLKPEQRVHNPLGAQASSLCSGGRSVSPPQLDQERSREHSHFIDDPISLFQTWLQEAVSSGIEQPTAMTLATVDPDGYPDARMLLLKGVDESGFVFYTNMQSRKAQALSHDPRAALCFYWDKIGKQARVRGRSKIVSDEEADTYFATRPRLSQISAWASKQSQPMHGYFELEAQVAKAALHFGFREVPRPPFWSGFRVVPERIEFWVQKPFRRHHRIVYERFPDGWRKQWLYP